MNKNFGFWISELTVADRLTRSQRRRRARARRWLAVKQVPSPQSPVPTPARGAFTLVEMLVAMGLIVLMMTLFATIFQVATGMMATQKGIAENDQRVRLVMTLLRNDLNPRLKDPNTGALKQTLTFRSLIPFGGGETAAQAPINPVTGTAVGATDRLGYFYISEGNIDDDTDDILALTVSIPASLSERYFGRAALIFPSAATATPPSSYGPNAGTTAGSAGYPPAGTGTPPTPPAGNYWPNQPEFDDVVGFPNQAGSSTIAEVCYFLRAGTLYRRVMLVRNPTASVTPQPQDGTPTDSAGAQLNMSVYAAGGTRYFLNDFDFSAVFDQRTSGALRLHGTGSNVANDSLVAAVSSISTNPFVLGNPAYRFGFDCTWNTAGSGSPGASYGFPREYDSNGNFIGRFTHRETSSASFGYPGIGTSSPMAQATTVNLDVTTDPSAPGSTRGQVTTYPSGPRAGEDVLMTNVHKFDIKVWDPSASYGPDGAPGFAGIDDDGINGTDDPGEAGAYGSDDGAFVDIGNPGTTVVFGGNNYTIGQYASPNAYYNPTASTQITNTANYYGRNRYDTWNPQLDLLNQTSVVPAYRDVPPFRPFNSGRDGKPGKANFDDDNLNGPDDAGELGWPGTDDFVPLGAIQIKISFFDATSKQLKEVTLVQSLLYSP